MLGAGCVVAKVVPAACVAQLQSPLASGLHPAPATPAWPQNKQWQHGGGKQPCSAGRAYSRQRQRPDWSSSCTRPSGQWHIRLLRGCAVCAAWPKQRCGQCRGSASLGRTWQHRCSDPAACTGLCGVRICLHACLHVLKGRGGSARQFFVPTACSFARHRHFAAAW